MASATRKPNPWRPVNTATQGESSTGRQSQPQPRVIDVKQTEWPGLQKSQSHTVKPATQGIAVSISLKQAPNPSPVNVPVPLTSDAYALLVGSQAGSSKSKQESIEDDTQVHCIICLEQIEHADPIWSCGQCFDPFHLECIQAWSVNVAHKPSPLIEVPTIEGPPVWRCPKCRKEHPKGKELMRYFCYCQKVENPPLDRWLVPHSCGQTCEKRLSSNCSHKCTQLCHPGPCPPCPKNVNKSCFCRKESKTVRCSSGQFSCGDICDRPLSCGVHTCPDICHSGSCSPCAHKVLRKCVCNRLEQEILCTGEIFRCDLPCDKNLGCGNHTCKLICHEGPVCPPCPMQGVRTCPCGKKGGFTLPCNKDTPSCGDTCDKPLSCGKHRCFERCHQGNCPKCLHTVMKHCQCRANRKEIPCWDSFRCEHKCNRMRNCQRHNCRRRCCDGKCPPCTEVCNRKLGCGIHKCTLPCHTGPCFPCPLTFQKTCFCGETIATFPCGKQRVAQPPLCSKECKVPAKCHHPARAPHKCHFGECPPCKFTCLKELKGCEHLCHFSCHDIPEDIAQKEEEYVIGAKRPPRPPIPPPMPCPMCPVPTTKKCVGEHKDFDVVCSTIPFSCEETCGQQLDCGNHTCQKKCHALITTTKKPAAASQLADEEAAPKKNQNCSKCRLSCQKSRKCHHTCNMPCHPGECAPCNESRKRKCHCGGTVLYLKCQDFISALFALGDENNDPQQNQALGRLLQCSQVCQKKHSYCSHVCTETCHPGECPQSKKCTKKQTLRCPCKRRKTDFVCHEVHEAKLHGQILLPCDSECLISAKASGSLPGEQLEDEVDEDMDNEANLDKNPDAKASNQSKDKRRKRIQNEKKDAASDLEDRKKKDSVFMHRLYVILVIFVAIFGPFVLAQLRHLL